MLKYECDKLLNSGGIVLFVAICDDDKIFCDMLRELLDEYIHKSDFRMEIETFSGGEELLASSRKFDLVFLDHSMKGISGMETARRLRAMKNNCGIIFVTSYPEIVYESFEVHTFRFLLKPVDKGKLFAALDSFFAEREKVSSLPIYNGGEYRLVRTDEILYLEAKGRCCCVVTGEESLITSKTISQVTDLLPKHCFFRIHRSYTVNLYAIVSLGKDDVELSNGIRLPIGRSKASAFRKEFLGFFKNNYSEV